MQKKGIVLVAALAVSASLLLSACSKKEESAGKHDPLKGGTTAPSIDSGKMPANHQAMMQQQGGGGNMPANHGAMVGEGGEAEGVKKPRRTVVPDDVKATWKTVKLLVKNKKTGNSKSYEVAMNSDFKLPNTDLVVKVGAFMPDFSMPPGMLTSVSNEPNNPALFAKIFEKNEEKYSGWLFAKFPDMHGFEHDEYSIVLENDFGGKTSAASPQAAESHGHADHGGHDEASHGHADHGGHDEASHGHADHGGHEASHDHADHGGGSHTEPSHGSH